MRSFCSQLVFYFSYSLMIMSAEIMRRVNDIFENKEASNSMDSVVTQKLFHRAYKRQLKDARLSANQHPVA